MTRILRGGGTIYARRYRISRTQRSRLRARFDPVIPHDEDLIEERTKISTKKLAGKLKIFNAGGKIRRKPNKKSINPKRTEQNQRNNKREEERKIHFIAADEEKKREEKKGYIRRGSDNQGKHNHDDPLTSTHKYRNIRLFSRSNNI